MVSEISIFILVFLLKFERCVVIIKAMGDPLYDRNGAALLFHTDKVNHDS